jgi:putative peptide zinc metalloprotease protein
MDRSNATSDLERRKHVKLRLRPDLDIAPQKYEGKTFYVVKDPVSLRYYRFKEQEYFLLQLMEGKSTLDDAQKAFEKRFRPDRLTLEDLEHFAQQLLTAGLAQNESPQAGQQLFDRRKKRKRSEWMQTLTNILYIKIPVIDPDKLLGHMLRYLWWIFTVPFALVSIGVMLSAVILVATHFDTFREKLPSYHEFFNLNTILYLWISLGVVKIIHEFGHGLSCKAFGGEVHEMGLLFLCLSPCLYCNVSDAWTLPNKWKRIIISGAGIYVELIIAALATFVWWNTPTQPFVNNLSLSVMVVCSVSTVVFNANPLMRYDGYYVLLDWLEIPNLRDRSNRYLSNLVQEHCLGIEVQPEPYMAPGRRVLFVTYAIVSWLYRWVVTFSILKFMDSFLQPYKLGVISRFMMLFAAGSMVGWPLYHMGKNLYKRGRFPDMKRARVTATAVVVGLVVLFVVAVPLPVSRVRNTAVVQVQPDPESFRKLYLPMPAVLDKLHVKDGQHVNKGEVLAEFSSLDLDTKLLEAESQYRTRVEQEDALYLTLRRTTEAAEQARIRNSIATIAGEKGKYAADVENYREMQDSLKLRAPIEGVVMSSPRINEVGKQWEKGGGNERAFCTIADPTKLRATLPVVPSDYALLKQDTQTLKDCKTLFTVPWIGVRVTDSGVFPVQGEDEVGLPVLIRVQGRDNHVWRGSLEPLPESPAEDVPYALTSKAGGTVATKPTQRPGVNAPQAQQYLVSVAFDEPDEAVQPGALAQVKIDCKWRSCAWWAYRTVTGMFDLHLQ